MIIEDPTPAFPNCPGFGFTAEPRYLVKIVQRDGGYERRDRKWSRPLHRYTGVAIRDRVDADVQDLLYFWHAMGGMSTSFRFKDYLDFKSSKTNEDISATDAPFVELTPDTFQLVKVYTAGPYQQVREIKRPRGETFQVANAGNVVQDPDSYVLDESTGILSISTDFNGTPTSWGGEFDVYARFDSEFPAQIIDSKVQDLTIAIAEVRE